MNVETNSMIYGKDTYLSMDQVKTHLNCNSMVIGASGAGKTRSFLYPNLMQMNGSYIIIDTKGQAFWNFARMFEKNGYTVKLLNLVNPKQSMHYNPFHYFKNQTDLETFVKNIVYAKNEDDPAVRAADRFWDQASEILLGALCGYIWKECLPNERNLPSVLRLLEKMEIREDDDQFKCVVDYLFDDVQTKYDNLKEHDPDLSEPFYLRKYRNYKNAAGKTAKSIIISIAAHLARYENDDIRHMMIGEDEIEIEKIGQQKTAVFVIVSDTNNLFHPIASLFIDQCMQTLVYQADENDVGKLPVHVSMYIDDAASFPIYGMNKYMAEVRSREISINLMFQNENQLTTCYGSAGTDIRENCNTYLFLGGNSASTEEALGKWFDMDPREVHLLPYDRALIMQKSHDGKRIVKFFPEEHPNYKYTGLSNPNNRVSPKLFSDEFIEKREEMKEQEQMRLKKKAKELREKRIKEFKNIKLQEISLDEINEEIRLAREEQIPGKMF